MRSILVLLHRWVGLFIAGFLFVAGLTGSVISWDHELDAWLNQELFISHSKGQPRDSLALLQKVEAQDLRAQVSYLPFHTEPGRSMVFGVTPRIDPTTQSPYGLDYNQIFVDPVSGDILGQREWGEASFSRKNLLPFLYKLHYSLQIPSLWGIDRWGIWLMGGVALAWLFDNFVAFSLTLPARPRKSRHSEQARWWQRWKISWRVRWRSNTYKLNFDLHRAGGLWVWLLLFMLAFTSFSLNLYREVFYPLMSLVSEVTPGPFETRTPAPLKQPVVPHLGFAESITVATTEAARRHWPEPVGGAYYAEGFGIYAINFFTPGNDHGDGGFGTKTLYIDGQTGDLLGDKVPWQGTAADVFVQLQFPLHSGRIAGLPGRIMISAMGLIVAMLSATGIYIWWKKYRARRFAERQKAQLKN